MTTLSPPPVLQNTFSSSRPCWFTTVTCTQDISSRTAAAPPRSAAPPPSAPSGSGCRTTRCEKPACTRCCLPTLTCSSTRECGGWTSLCAPRSNWTLATSKPERLQALRSNCPSCMCQLQHCYRWAFYDLESREENNHGVLEEVILLPGSQQHVEDHWWRFLTWIPWEDTFPSALIAGCSKSKGWWTCRAFDTCNSFCQCGFYRTRKQQHMTI